VPFYLSLVQNTKKILRVPKLGEDKVFGFTYKLLLLLLCLMYLSSGRDCDYDYDTCIVVGNE
jgi:hypothetical protein